MNRKLIVTLKSPAQNLELTGAQMLRKDGLTYEFEVEGDIPALLQDLTTLPVSDIAFPEPDLQEIFMNYYNGKHDE